MPRFKFDPFIDDPRIVVGERNDRRVFQGGEGDNVGSDREHGDKFPVYQIKRNKKMKQIKSICFNQMSKTTEVQKSFLF